MRRLPALFLIGVAACSPEPDFDERYAAAEDKIRARAQAIDSALAEKAGEGEEAPVGAETSDQKAGD